jgi:signal transduction histidine kinase
VEDAAEAAQALAKLQRLIADLLDVSRLEQGVFTLSSQLIDLVMIAREAVAAVGVESHPIDLRLPDELVLQADPVRIAQALQNLIGNAIQHTPQGTPILVSLGTQRHQEGEWAIVDVHDEGPGIPGDLLSRLFIRHSAGPESEGMGLGLYLARGIAEAHGGTLTVESEVGSGTTFHLTLPCDGYSMGSSPA